MSHQERLRDPAAHGAASNPAGPGPAGSGPAGHGPVARRSVAHGPAARNVWAGSQVLAGSPAPAAYMRKNPVVCGESPAGGQPPEGGRPASLVRLRGLVG